MLNDHLAYLVGQFEHRTGIRPELTNAGDMHHWKAGNWSHVTRGSYNSLTFDRMQEESDSLVRSYAKSLNG